MSKHVKTIEQTYKVLSDIEHIRKRVGMYVGSPVAETRTEFCYDFKTEKMVSEQVTFVPALVKIISEVIDNVVDEHKRNPTKVNQLSLTIKDSGEIIIKDNGGIPVVKHKEFDMYVPEIIFGMLRSGSNYNDDEEQSVIGTNGIGAKSCVILSEYFIVDTSDGSNNFKQEYSDGMNKRSTPVVKVDSSNHTKITFKPDYAFFGLSGMDDDHKKKIVRRLLDVAGTNPSLKVTYNSQRLAVKNFHDYIKLYSDKVVYDNTNPNWSIGIAHGDGFTNTSFVNSVETYVGGTHVDYVTEQIVSGLREFFKKKHKVDVKPSDIKNHLHLFISCNVNRPKFSSQTKEHMISNVNDYGNTYTLPPKVIKQLTESSIIQSVLDWVEAKRAAAERAEMRKLTKDLAKSNPKHVENFDDATSRIRQDCMLILVEGLSAAGGINSARDTKTMGVFPLRGKPINVYEMSNIDVLENREFKNILTVLGLEFGVEVKGPGDLRFGKIVFGTDQDLDGLSIRGLLINAFYKYWPELFKLGMVYILNTPLAKVSYGKTVLDFYDLDELDKWRAKNTNLNYKTSYYKGLGTSTTEEWAEYLSPAKLADNLVQITYSGKEDEETLKLLFSKDKGMTDKRKVWLFGEDNENAKHDTE